MRFTVYQESNIGNRKMNQDRMGYCFSRDAVLMVMADGMGGHLQGEIAAQIALQTIASMFQSEARPRLRNPHKFLQDSFYIAHKEILRYASAHKLLETPRTTVVACVVQDDEAYWAHAGDSRLYWIRQGKLLGVTKDHSRVQNLIAQGMLREADREKHPDRNKLVNCLGSPADPMVEINKKSELMPGDVLFLCSDGLWAKVPEKVICAIFASKTVMHAVPVLIALALQEAKNKSDNVTGLAMSFHGSNTGAKRTGVSTKTLPIGAFTTTIRAPHFEDTEKGPLLSEREIEEAISEINGSLDKAGPSGR